MRIVALDVTTNTEINPPPQIYMRINGFEAARQLSPALISKVKFNDQLFVSSSDSNHTFGFVSTKAKDVLNDKTMDIRIVLAPKLVSNLRENGKSALLAFFLFRGKSMK